MIHNSNLVKKLHSYVWRNNMGLTNSHCAVKLQVCLYAIVSVGSPEWDKSPGGTQQFR